MRYEMYFSADERKKFGLENICDSSALKVYEVMQEVREEANRKTLRGLYWFPRTSVNEQILEDEQHEWEMEQAGLK